MRKRKFDHEYWVYLIASLTGTLYVGMTDDIYRRVWEHKTDQADGFTKRYQCHKLVYSESFQYVNDAIRREKEIKGWIRRKKEELIKTQNPHWIDFAENWYKF
jgi:putative endonuclease